MVKYYGRAKTRVGAVNTNQLGLKMSGCPSKIGKQGALVKYQSRRVQCNQKFCGPVYYQGQMWSWNSERCVPRAPRTQAFNSGVGHINAPRFGCSTSCSVDESSLVNAIKIIMKYFDPYYKLVLMPDKELFRDNLDLHKHLKTNLIDLADKSKVDLYPSHIKQAMHQISIHSLNKKFKNKIVKYKPVLIDLVGYHYLADPSDDSCPYGAFFCPAILGKGETVDTEIAFCCLQNESLWPDGQLQNYKTGTNIQFYYQVGTINAAVFIYLLYNGLTQNDTIVTRVWNIIQNQYGNIENWDTSQITDMGALFADPYGDPSVCSDANGCGSALMIQGKSAFHWQSNFIKNTFNPDLSGWNTSNVVDMVSMFNGARVFNRDLSSWDVSKVTNATDFSKNSALSSANIPNFRVST